LLLSAHKSTESENAQHYIIIIIIAMHISFTKAVAIFKIGNFINAVMHSYIVCQTHAGVHGIQRFNALRSLAVRNRTASSEKAAQHLRVHGPYHQLRRQYPLSNVGILAVIFVCSKCVQPETNYK